MTPLKIALIGYGKMGKEVEAAAVERGHSILLRISSSNRNELAQLKNCDVAVEFTYPQNAVENINTCFDAGIPVIVGTTGWNEKLEEVESACRKKNGALLYSSNFSVGVNIFFEINKLLAQLMNGRTEYDVTIEEMHHTAKLDKPSGTAITLAEQVIKSLSNKTAWALEDASDTTKLIIHSIRKDDVVGKHVIQYRSAIDDITISHEAKNRKGFAKGAVLAAEFIAGKKGIYTMKDVISIKFPG